MTKELRERFDEQFSNLSLYMRNRIWSWHEQEIIEERRRMKERCLECVPETSWAIPFGESGITSCNAIRTAISSLK